MRSVFFACLLMGCGADCGGGGKIEDPLFEGSFETPTVAGLNSLDLPPGPEGHGYSISPTPLGMMWADVELKDSVTAAGACAALIVACVSPDERNIHGCFLNTATCATETPWNEELCCPTACLDAYRERRESGLNEVSAFSGAVFDLDGCIPGMSDAVGGER